MPRLRARFMIATQAVHPGGAGWCHSGKGNEMTNEASMAKTPMWRRLRWLVWGGAAALLAMPLLAMQFTDEVDWTPLDFVVMGTILALCCVAFELVIRVARNHAYVLASGVAIATALLVTWSNLAVGIVGDEGNPVNLVFFGVLLVALVGAAMARLAPRGMARAMAATAIAQALSALLAVYADEWRVVAIIGVFAALWLLSAALFRKSAGDAEGGDGSAR